MRIVTVGLMLRSGEQPKAVVARVKKLDVWDPWANQVVPVIHHDGYRFSHSPEKGWLGRVEWEADVP